MGLVKGKDNFTVRHCTCPDEREHVYDGHVSSWEDELTMIILIPTNVNTRLG